MNSEAQLEIFRCNIRTLRCDNNYTKKLTAQHLGISVASLNKLESSLPFPNIPAAAIVRAAALFKVPVQTLLSKRL